MTQSYRVEFGDPFSPGHYIGSVEWGNSVLLRNYSGSADRVLAEIARVIRAHQENPWSAL